MVKCNEYYVKLTKIKSLIYDKRDKTDDDWNILERDLLSLIKNAPENNKAAYILLAKLNYERQHYNDSIDNYDYILDNYPETKEICLYGLMKNLIMTNDFLEANNCLDDLENELVNNPEAVYDFGIIRALLAYLNDYSANLSVDYEVYLYSRLEDENALAKYALLLDYIADCDFANANIIAKELSGKQKELEVDFNPLCTLINACMKKKKPISKEEFYNQYIEYVKARDYQNLYKLVSEQLSDLPSNFNIYNFIMKLVEKGYADLAIDLYNKLDITKQNTTMNKYMKKAEQEEKKYAVLDEENKERYKNALYNIRKNIEEENYENALDIASGYFYITNSPIFLYYIGKAFYKLEYYKEAKDYLINYLKHGSVKLRKSFKMLTNCVNHLNQPTISIKEYCRYYNDLIRYTIVPNNAKTLKK